MKKNRLFLKKAASVSFAAALAVSSVFPALTQLAPLYANAGQQLGQTVLLIDRPEMHVRWILR